ncbi:MAG: ABC-F family ATP-binding cassette domain-containing protein [Micavibrio sp.]
MLSVTNLTYRIAGRTILENCNINVMDGWKVGVVGLNGAGKSTLFKLAAGELHADGGDISMTNRHKLAMVRQDMPEVDTPLIDLVVQANTELAQLLADAETETDPYKISEIHERLMEMDAYSAPSRAAVLLTGLGFKDEQLYEPFSSFSGGWRMRVALASVLFLEPEVLMLDEPTNHLDLEAIMWLESYLANYPHTLMIISHDRDLLNKCVDHIIHVDKKQLTMYTGTYDTFERERAERLGLQQKMHEKQKAHRAHMQAFVDRFKAKASKARQAQSRMKALEKMDIVDAVIAERAVKFVFPQPEKLPAPIMSINHANVGYTEGKPILRGIHQNIDMDDRIALMGANGNGKSTLIKLIAGKLGAMEGEVVRSGKLRIGYFSQHQTDELDMSSTPFEEMKKLMVKKKPDVTEPAVRAKLGSFGFSKDLADNTISKLSGGEKARLLFAIMSFDAPHMLLLDEPTNHLDMDAREALVQALNNYEGAVILVSHDPSMVERVADRLWLVKDGACEPFDGDLDDYRNFIVQSRREERKEEKAKKNKAGKNEKSENKKPSAAVFKKIEDTEQEVSRLTQEKEKFEQKMADPSFYTNAAEAIKTQKVYDQILADLAKQEALWLEAQESLEKASA